MTSEGMRVVSDELDESLETLFSRVESAYERYRTAVDDLVETAASADDDELDADEVEFYIEEWGRRMERATGLAIALADAMALSTIDVLAPFPP